MTRARRISLTLATVCVSAAAAAGLAHAHHGADAAINGAPTGKLGLVQVYGNRIALHRIKLECPPPEGGEGCPVAITVKTADEYRLSETPPKPPRKRITLARMRYVLEANRDHAQAPALPLTENGVTVFDLFGPYIKATVRVTIAHDEPIVRDFQVTLKT